MTQIAGISRNETYDKDQDEGTQMADTRTRGQRRQGPRRGDTDGRDQ